MLEKSIANATRLEFLNDYFRPAYFIHITRNGYAVAEGIRRKANPRRWRNPDYRERYPLTLCANQWQATEELICATRDRLDHYHALRYEDLVTAPRETLDGILDFIGLPRENLLREDVRVHGETGPIQDMNRKSLQNLKPDEITAVTEAAGNCLARLGYRAEA